jgi:diguanylate cyclase (GGDEF)-like protein/PAS domain S-box-containing protein
MQDVASARSSIDADAAANCPSVANGSADKEKATGVPSASVQQKTGLRHLLARWEAKLEAAMRLGTVRRLVRVLGAIVALATALSIPVGHAIVGHLKEAERLSLRAELAATRLASAVSTLDDWQFDLERLKASLGASEDAGTPVARRVVDEHGATVFSSGFIARPRLARSAPIMVGGASVGRVELTASLRPLLLDSGLIAILTLALGAIAYLVLAIVPLRVLDRSLGELTAAGEAAKKQHMLLDTALGNMAQGLAMFDADERIVIVNNQYAEIYGLPPSQVRPGATLREIVDLRAAQGHFPGMSADEAYELLRSRTQCAEPTQVLYKLASGRVVAALVQPRASGGWVVTHEDVTERESLHALLTQQNTVLREREEQLKAQNHQLDVAAQKSRNGLALLDAALNNMTHGLAMFDAQHQLVVCNQAYLEMYGYVPGEVKPGMSIRELIALRQARGLHGDTDAEDSARDWIADPKSDLTLIKHFSDGRIISVRRRMREEGGYVVTHEDITERHCLEQNEREAREVLSAVFDAAPAAIICLDLDGRVMVWSRGAERLFGYAAAEVVGGPYPLVPEGKEEEFKQLFQRALDGETFRDVHVQRRSKDGRLLEVNFASSAMLDHDGTVRGIAYALTDITESEKLRKRFKEQHEQLDIALNNMSQGITMFDAEQHLVVCNNLYAKMFGLTADQVKPGTTLGQILAYRQANGCYDASTTGSGDRRASSFESVRSGTQRLADGRIIQVSCRKTGNGGHVITHQDITESERLNARLEQQHRLLKEHEEKLRAQNLQLDAALNNMVQGLAMFDADQRLVICNRRYAEMYGLADDEVLPGTPLPTILNRRLLKGGMIAENAGQLLQSMFSEADGSNAGHITTELGDGRFISVAVQPMAGGGTLTTHQDITEQRRSEAKIVHMALHDTLTGLPNRVLLNERLEHALTRVKRGEVAAIHILDLDFFKSVNDTLGHAAGDKLLQMVADRLRILVRETDTIARMGGDEFAVLQVAIGQPADATTLAHRIIETVSKPYDIDGHQVVIGTSVGIAVGPADGMTPDQLTRNADLALYRAKGEGRGTFCFFEPEMDAQMQARRAMEYDLRKALVAGEFELHYLPTFNLGLETITGMEALIRWRHPTLGLIRRRCSFRWPRRMASSCRSANGRCGTPASPQ